MKPRLAVPPIVRLVVILCLMMPHISWAHDAPPSPGSVYPLGNAAPNVTTTSSSARTSVTVRTPVPDSLYYPEERVGFVAFGMWGVDLSRLHAGFVKLEDRGPHNWERKLGLDFCTVLRVGQGFCVPSDPSNWEECQTRIAQLVAANPGHLWFIGNEPENPCRPGWMGSAEYARTYHAVYHFIKDQDPSAQVGTGGVVVPSPARIEWLERVLDHYRSIYEEPMPVDVWSIHNLLLSDCPGSCACRDPNPCPDLCCSGGYLPPEFGCDSSKRTFRPLSDQANAEEFMQLIRGFRQWMATREEARDKPLIITEVGVLAFEIDSHTQAPYPQERINQFMAKAFDFMMTETDPEIGYAPDGYRLVQRWTWYSLRDRNFNGFLFGGQGNITDFGLNFGNYTARFLPVSPVTIFFQRGWTGYTENCDTTLRPAEPGPSGPSLWISADGTQKALLQFDLSVLPSNVEVVSATLGLFSQLHSGVGDMAVNCYGIKRPWDVQDATWENATQTTQWEEPGCNGPNDRELTPSSTVVVTSGETWHHFDVTELAQSWVADPSTNHGVVLEGQAAGTGYWRFVSSDQEEEPPQAKHRLRPKLELIVRLPEPTPTPTSTPTPTPTDTLVPTPTATAATPTTAWRVYLPIVLKRP
jgi:hypothetical protein